MRQICWRSSLETGYESLGVSILDERCLSVPPYFFWGSHVVSCSHTNEPQELDTPALVKSASDEGFTVTLMRENQQNLRQNPQLSGCQIPNPQSCLKCPVQFVILSCQIRYTAILGQETKQENCGANTLFWEYKLINHITIIKKKKIIYSDLTRNEPKKYKMYQVIKKHAFVTITVKSNTLYRVQGPLRYLVTTLWIQHNKTFKNLSKILISIFSFCFIMHIIHVSLTIQTD